MNVALPILMFLVGFAAGGAVIWFLRIADLRSALSHKEQQLQQRDEENVQLKEQIAELQTSLSNEREKVGEKVKLLSDAQEQFEKIFKALATDALRENNKQFDSLSKPVRETLREISTKISVVDSSAKGLSVETSKLVKALQKPEVRGQWGEMHLRRVVEVTGMTERCDFDEQQSIGGANVQQRPDLIVHLPGERNLAVDAKAPIRAFLEAAEATDETLRQSKMKEFVSHVKERIKLLGSKTYHQSLDHSPEFVVLYLPTEAVFSAALMLDDELLEYAARQRVHLAGPTILITLLRAVAHGWKQEAVADNAREICTLAEELYQRLSKFGSHMREVGNHLTKSTEAYNAAVGTLESRVMPQARRFEGLGAAPADGHIEQLAPVETAARNLQCTEFALAHADGEVHDPDLSARPRQRTIH